MKRIARPHPHLPIRLLTFTHIWANVLIPEIIIQSTFVTVDPAQRRCSQSLDVAHVDAGMEG